MVITWLDVLLAVLLILIVACILVLRFGFRDLEEGGDD